MHVAARIAVATALVATSAHADPTCAQLPNLTAAHSAEAQTESQSLFAKGLALQKTGKDDEACKMFESSLVLEPQLGNILNVANCRERAGKLIEARALFEQAADLATAAGDRRATFAQTRTQALDALLVRVVVHIAEPATAGLDLRIAGCAAPAGLAELHRVTVPGAISIDASAPGKKSFHVDRDAAAGAEVAIDIPALLPEVDFEAERKASEAEALAATERRKEEQLRLERERTAARRFDRHPARKWALAGGGVGAATLVTGVIFGIESRNAQSAFDSAGCGDRSHLLLDPAYASCASEANRGERDALLGNAFLFGGGAALAAAVIVFAIDPGNVPRPEQQRAALVVTPRSIGAVVRWSSLAVWLCLVAACGFNRQSFSSRACNQSADCRPDEDCTGGACVQRACTADLDCGGAYAFACTSGGCVVQTCTTGADCASGFACPSGTYCQASFNVTSAAATTSSSVAVTFDAPPDPTTATNLANYAVSGLTLSGTPVLAGSTVTLSTSQQATSAYEITVTGVTRAVDQAPLVTATAMFTGRTAFDVSSAVATSARNVAVTFDATPDPVTAAAVANYSINGLAVTGAPLVSGNQVLLTTAPQSVLPYTVTVTGVHRASDGEPLTTATADFTGRNDFNVALATTVDSHHVAVTFDAPPDSAQATTATSYDIRDASNTLLAVTAAPTLSVDNLTVTLTTATQAAGTYSITVLGVTRASDAEPLNIHTANFMGRTAFDVVAAVSTSNTTLQVTFDATPTTAQANDITNYSIPGLTIAAASLTGNTVTLTTSPQSAVSYTLTASAIVRAADNEPMTVASAMFTGRAAFDVVAASSSSSHTVVVTFDAAPSIAQASTAANYSIPGLNVISAIPSGNVVTLTTSAQSATLFDVTVSGVTRASDAEALTVAVTSFPGRAPFNVVDATVQTSHSFVISFDSTPDPTTAANIANYTVPGLALQTASLSGAKVTITTAAQTPILYQVTVTNVTRASDAEPMTSNSAAFTGRAPFNVTAALSTGSTSMTVTFDSAPEASGAKTPGNYSITSGSLSLSGTPVLVGNTVTLSTSAQTAGASYQITVSNVVRASDSEPLTMNAASFSGKSGFNVASAASVSTTSMSVTFDAAPTAASAQNVANYNVPGLTLSGPVTLVGNTVTMTTTAQAGQSYTVTVSNVTRASDSSPLAVNTANFTHTTFNVANAIAPSSHSIAVTFDAVPNASQATTLGNYVVKDASNNTLAISGAPLLSSQTVTITTAAQTGGKGYTVTVSGVTRASDSTTMTTNTAGFSGIATFNVAAATSLTSASIAISFDAPPNPVQAATLGNYVVGGLTLKGTPIVSGTTVTIATGVQNATTYALTVTGVTRASDGEPLTGSSASFTGTAQGLPTVTNVVVSSTNPNNGTTFYNTGTATVVITGTQFTGVACPSGVILDDKNGNGVVIHTSATTCVVDSDTQITAMFPAGLVTNGTLGYNVLVTNTAGGNLTSAVKLVVKAGLLISEIYIGTSGAGNNTHEFFELYNPTATSIDIGTLGLNFHFRNSSGADSVVSVTSVSLPNRTVVSHGFMLLCSSQSDAGDAWYAHRDGTYDASSIELALNDGLYISTGSTAQVKVIDKVGWGSQPAGGFEGTALPNLSASSSTQRKPAGGNGDATDTDANASDFNPQSTSITPKGTQDGTEP